MSTTNTPSHPPIAEQHNGTRVRDIHGEHFDDPWDWLRDDTNPNTIAHIEAENQWTDHITAPLRPFRDTLISEMKAHTVEDEVTAPVREGNWWYFRRYHAGKSYPSHHRIPATGPHTPILDPHHPSDTEELLVDQNVHAEGLDFFRLTDLTPSPDGTRIAWARDETGDERWTWIIQDDNGLIIDDSVSDAGYGFAWSADGQYFIYTRVNDAWRSHQVWAHRIGTTSDNDLLLLDEPDDGFDVWISRAKDPRWVAIHSSSTTTGQAWLWSRHQPRASLLPVSDREHMVQIKAEPAGDHLLFLHTRSTQEGSIAAAPFPTNFDTALHERTHNDPQPTPQALGGSLISTQSWVSVREPQSGERIVDVEAFSTFAVVSMRSASLTQVAVHLRQHRAQSEYAANVHDLWNEGRFVEVDSPVRTLLSAGVGDFDSESFAIEHHSVTVPPTAEDVVAATLERTVIKRQNVPAWDSAEYVEERVWVPSRDGITQIPVTLVHHRDVHADGSNPGWLHGYGSYEIPFDAEFDVLRLPALKRGFVHVIAHVRGGGEMGRAWYEDGKELRKVNTFTDFIDVALWLQSSGWVAPGRLIAEGRSAGGLLMGAVTNMAPEVFAAILAGVPFVDALTTILDASLPLTVGEWEEWGNPIDNGDVYALMRAYTPYENVTDGVRLPAVMATTSMNDTRVFYVEPAKWVQRLRQATAGVEGQRPIVLRTEMVAGHGGRSGRYGRWEARSEEFAFVMSEVGVSA